MKLKIYPFLMKNFSKEKHFTMRKAIVQEALEIGIKPTARRFDMSKNTIFTSQRLLERFIE